MFQTHVAEKIKKHIVCSVTSLPITIYEIMWKNMVEPGRSQMTIQYHRRTLHAG